MNPTKFSDRFPNEILAKILELLCVPRTISSTGDLHSCLLVNRHWHNVAMPILWHTIHLDVDGNKVQDIDMDSTRTALSSEEPGSEDSEELEPWYDWAHWLDYESRAPPTTDCWGDTLPLPLYANILGVRPHNLNLLFRSTQCLLQRKYSFWMTYSSPFDLCRKITVSFVDYSKTDKNKSRIIAIILSCTNLLYFDIYLHLQKVPTLDERNAWAILANHLSSQPLRALRIRVKWAKRKHLPISLPGSSNQSGLSFDVLRNCLTHLSFEFDYSDAVFATEPRLSDFECLKFFAIYGCPGNDHVIHVPKGMSRLLQSVQVEEMGFSWPINFTTLPLTLTKLFVITNTDGFPIMSVFKQLVNLETFTSTYAKRPWSGFDAIQLIQNQSVENEDIGCRRLRVLHFDGPLQKCFVQAVASQCPLLSDIKLTSRVPDEEIFAVIDQCRALHSITLYDHSDDIYSHLRYSKNLVNITLEMMDFPTVAMLESFLIELPLLQRLYISDWFKEDSEDNFVRLISDEFWTEAQVNHLRRCMKPHHDGYDYMYLDMRALRNNCWMNDMELAEN